MIKVSKLRKYNPSMSVPGDGKVEVPVGVSNQQGERDSRNARHYAGVMAPFGGSAKSADHQYSEKGKDGR